MHLLVGRSLAAKEAAPHVVVVPNSLGVSRLMSLTPGCHSMAPPSSSPRSPTPSIGGEKPDPA
jgi:hypothetical protein